MGNTPVDCLMIKIHRTRVCISNADHIRDENNSRNKNKRNDKKKNNKMKRNG